jgi:hypothetical protein
MAEIIRIATRFNRESFALYFDSIKQKTVHLLQKNAFTLSKGVFYFVIVLSILNH